MLTLIGDRLTMLLPPKLRPFSKAVWPTIATAITVVVNGIVTDAFSMQEVKLALVGVGMAILAYLTPNKSPAQPPVA